MKIAGVFVVDQGPRFESKRLVFTVDIARVTTILYDPFEKSGIAGGDRRHDYHRAMGALFIPPNFPLKKKPT